MAQQQQTTPQQQADIRPVLTAFLRQLKRLLPLVLLLAALGAGIGYLSARLSYTPVYKSEAIFALTVATMDGDGEMTYNMYYDNAVTMYAAECFPVILSSDLMREALLNKLGTDTLNGTITADNVSDSNYFQLSVTSPSPEDAYRILNTVMEIFPQVTIRILGDVQFSVKREADLPTAPCNSPLLRETAVQGGCTGLLLGLLIVFLVSSMNRTVVTEEDVKSLTSLACLSSVPDMGRKHGSKKAGGNLILTGLKTDPVYRESFRLLRLKLLRILRETGGNIIMVTSSLPSEGKSSVAANAALSLASDGKKVLLIDGDLRSPSVKAFFSLQESSPGLADCLQDSTARINFPNVPGTSLFLFAGDNAVKDPTPLLRRDRLTAVLNALKSRYDYIVIDTPPCVMMADATAFCPVSDAVVYVIREDYVTRGALTEGIETITENGGTVSGFVLNRVTRAGAATGSKYGAYKYGGYSKYGSYGKYGRYGAYGKYSKQK